MVSLESLSCKTTGPFFFPVTKRPDSSSWPPLRGFTIHSLGTPLSVRLLWTSDQPDAETSTWQKTTLARDIHAPGRIRTRNPSKRVAAYQQHRQRGHRNRQLQNTHIKITFQSYNQLNQDQQIGTSNLKYKRQGKSTANCTAGKGKTLSIF